MGFIRRFWLGLALVALVPVEPGHADNGLSADIEAVTGSPAYRQGRWGILVIDGNTRQSVYQYHADERFLPASTIKLFHCSAALADLGPAYVFQTPVYARGRVIDGRLQGDLVLVAQGDVTLGGRTDPGGHLAFKDDDHTYANSAGAQSELTDTDPLAGLKSLARQVAAAGIRQVEGEVLVDDRLFARTPGSGSGPEWLSPIVVNDNVVDVLVRPGGDVGQPAPVEVRPKTDYVTMEAQVVTAPAGEDTHLEIKPTGPRRFLIHGRIALRSRPVLRIYPVDDPPGFARCLFIEVLRREGVTVAANPLQPRSRDLPAREDNAKLTPVALFKSSPFAELVKVTLKTSSNVYANTFPLLMAARHGKTTLAEGLEIQARFLSDQGVNMDTISIATAAGGSPHDAITPRASAQLLLALSRRPDFEVIRDGLPVLGVDGTLADVVPANSPARGKVRAKTGTYYVPERGANPGLLRCKALAGTMTTAAGQPLFFVIFLNDLPLPHGTGPGPAAQTLGHLCEILYASKPDKAPPAGGTTH